MGCGYYAAILAELVGPSGSVVAIEVEPERAAQAGKALAPWPQVAVRCANGATEPLEPCDVLIAGAGVTHPPDVWLEALKVGGRMIFPLMGSLADEHWGVAAVLYARRESETSFEARRLCDASYLEFIGARDAGLAERIDEALAADRGETIRSMRCDSHFEDDATCWLHGEHFCLSRLAPDQHQSAERGGALGRTRRWLEARPVQCTQRAAVWPPGAVAMMVRAALRRPYRTPGPFACLAATPNDDALRTCAIFGCGRPPQARAGQGSIASPLPLPCAEEKSPRLFLEGNL